MSHKFFRLFASLMLGLALSFASFASAMADDLGPLVNGDFETGDLSGWTTFTTDNGTLGNPSVIPFDTDNDGIATFSAQFNVGQVTFEGFDMQRGGGLFQEVNLTAGNLTISADIASDHPFAFCNSDGGTFQLLVDDAVVDSHDFGEMCGPVTKYSTLVASLPINTAGIHEIRFLITRGGLRSGVTNYLDDVLLSGSATKIVIEIDIKPDSQSNPINSKGVGSIPVAILSTPDFDAPSMVAKSTLTFGRMGDEHSLVSCNKSGEDVNGDGLLDLVCHFKTRLANFRVGDTVGILKGKTTGGISIEGRDVVRILK